MTLQSKLLRYHAFHPVSNGCVSRNAEASPRTRHAQLLLPVSRRSRADHAAAGMVSHKQTRAEASTRSVCVNRQQLLSCLFASETRRHCVEECWPTEQRCAGRSASGCSCSAAVASATSLLRVPSTCQAHHHIRAPA